LSLQFLKSKGKTSKHWRLSQTTNSLAGTAMEKSLVGTVLSLLLDRVTELDSLLGS